MIDINPYHLEIVTLILVNHVPDCEVRAFGSRATWTSKDYSDLDLAIVGNGPLEWRTLGKLRDAFEESTLPFRVDVLDWYDISDNFRKMIEADCTPIKKATAASEVRDRTTLGAAAEIVMGQSPPGSTVSPDDGTPLLNGPSEFGVNHPTPVQFTTDPRRYAQPGDILFCVRGSTGKMNWADREYAIGRGLAAIRHRKSPEFQPFLRAVIEHELPYLLAEATGSIFSNISAQQLQAMSFPLFSESEQRDIAHILGTLDDKIELNRRMNETLEAMAQALFKSWFVDFDPVRAKMEGRWRPGESLPGLPAHFYDLFPDRLVPSELGEIPEGWSVSALDEIVELHNGGTPSTAVNQYWNGEIPWYTAKDTPSPSDIFAVRTERTITPAGVQNSATKIFPVGTTIISARGTVGRLALLGLPMAMNQTCYGIRGNDGYLNYFIYWIIRMTITNIQSQTYGTIFDTITRQTFKFVDIVRPPIELVDFFERAIASIMEGILQNLNESDALINSKTIILPKLLEGNMPTIAPQFESQRSLSK